MNLVLSVFWTRLLMKSTSLYPSPFFSSAPLPEPLPIPCHSNLGFVCSYSMGAVRHNVHLRLVWWSLHKISNEPKLAYFLVDLFNFHRFLPFSNFHHFQKSISSFQFEFEACVRYCGVPSFAFRRKPITVVVKITTVSSCPSNNQSNLFSMSLIPVFKTIFFEPSTFQT